MMEIKEDYDAIQTDEIEYLGALDSIAFKAKQMMKNYTKKQLAEKYALYFITLHFPKDHPTYKVAKAKLEGEGY